MEKLQHPEAQRVYYLHWDRQAGLLHTPEQVVGYYIQPNNGAGLLYKLNMEAGVLHNAVW